MFFKFLFKILFLTNLFLCIVISYNCSNLKNRSNVQFYLWKSFQRSLKDRLFVENVDNLEDCKNLARKYKGLAFNFSPKERYIVQREDRIRSRDHYWQQPHFYFNCHILQCPENYTFKTMVNDTLFDYFSLYEKPIKSLDYICLPEIGLFKLHTIPETYENASLKCRQSENVYGILAHIASKKRTEALSRLINNYNEETTLLTKRRVYLAYVGLQYNSRWSNNFEFFNVEKENLNCFAYRAWEPGNPKLSSEFANASCVALTVNRGWKSVKCNRKLPFICEIWS